MVAWVLVGILSYLLATTITALIITLLEGASRGEVLGWVLFIIAAPITLVVWYIVRKIYRIRKKKRRQQPTGEEEV